MADPYSYPNGVLRNFIDQNDADRVQRKEADLSNIRIYELRLGAGPEPTFDKDHLSSLHRFIFQDVYPWAGRMRHERFEIDGVEYSPIDIAKGGTRLLAQSRINLGLANAFAHVEAVHGRSATLEDFAEAAGLLLGELSYAHPFREGNGRAQRAFVSELGRSLGYELDFASITRNRMMTASATTSADPDASDMIDLVRDAADPARIAALQIARIEFEKRGADPDAFTVRTARPNEPVVGTLLAKTPTVSSIINPDKHLIVAPTADLPALGMSGRVEFRARTPFPAPADGSSRERDSHPLSIDRERLARNFLTMSRGEADAIPELARAHRALDRLERELERQFRFEPHPDRDAAFMAGRDIIVQDLKAGRAHDRHLTELAIKEATGRERSQGRSIG